MISIVTPVYNKKKYLKACIDSVLAQTYQDWELILVDDGSIDDSADICKSYANQNSRIHYYYQENAGPGCARNLGLDKANGEYIVFIDADDFVASDYLQTLLSGKQYIFVVSGYTEVHEDKGAKIAVLPEHMLLLDHGPTKNEVFCKKNLKFFVGPCSKLYELRTLRENNIRFKSIPYGEDIIFNFNYMKHCSEVCVLPYAGYQNRILDGTLSRRHVTDMWKYMLQIETAANDAFSFFGDASWQFLIMRDRKLALINEMQSYNGFKKMCRMVNDKTIRKVKFWNLDWKDASVLILLRLRFYRCLYTLLRYVL